MKKSKKEEYYGTSVKRYYSMTGNKGRDNFGAVGFVYINYADIVDFDMLLKVVAHEVSHLLDDKAGVEQEILDFLKKGYTKHEEKV